MMPLILMLFKVFHTSLTHAALCCTMPAGSLAACRRAVPQGGHGRRARGREGGARAQRETASRIMYSDNIKFPAQHSRAWIDFVRRALVRP